jgi:hypothetical protein
MKQRWLLLLMAAIAAVVGGCAYTGMYRYPWYTTARTQHQGGWDYEGSLTPQGFTKSNGIGYTDWPFRPELAVRYGLSNRLQAGLSTDFAPGLGVEGEYELDRGKQLVYLRNRRVDSSGSCYEPCCCIFGRPRMAIGARASYYLNDNVTNWEGVYDVSPRFLLSNERPKTIPYAANLGFDYYGYNGFKNSEGGRSPSASALSAVLNIGVPLNFHTPIKLGDKLYYNLRLQPAVAFNFQIAGSAGYRASFSETAGLSMEVDAIDYRSGTEGRYKSKW